MITPTQHDKNEWSRMAQAAYKAGHNAIGHRYSAYASMPNNAELDVCVFDTLQRPYRQWLIWNDFMFHDMHAMIGRYFYPRNVVSCH